MRSIMVMNSKGGCGKTTLATNLASYFATQGKHVTLADFDRQASSIDWLKARPEHREEITGVAAWETGLRAARNTDVIVMDVPAGTRGQELTQMVRRAQTIIIPVMPSAFDMRACAQFIRDLYLVNKINRDEVKLAVVANRVRENTLVYRSLEEFLGLLDIPFLTHLRDTQNYIRAADQGLGIFEMAPSYVSQDLEQWEPLIKWVNSKRSLPVH
ncbi:MAG: chromosome partitioning protein [Gammaproteobacteria bacterium RBG_16_57_12]|nr:MAG: chromosome partitioning protein [Gammaproteobacteria bacterium RBG_16_57_12]